MKENAEVLKSGQTIERKEFMRQVGIGFGAIVLMNCLQACSPDDGLPDPNPGGNSNGKLDFTVDLKLAANSALNTKGGSLKINGVIIARTLADDVIAVALNCTHEGTKIDYRAATNDFRCPNHGSEFSSTGAVTKAPATVALKRYNVAVDETAKTVRIFE